MNTVLIEAHPLVRTGIAHLLRTLKGVTGVTVVEPDEGMFDAIETNADAGLLVIGLPLPHLDELSAIGEIMHRPHARHVVVLAESESPDIIRTLMQMGLSGYTLKHSPGEVIAASLELVLVGGQYIPASALLPESRLDGAPNPALAGDPQTDPMVRPRFCRQLQRSSWVSFLESHGRQA
ncbi:MAG: response regulator transcription factor, partial [Pseudomonadota bacterium]